MFLRTFCSSLALCFLGGISFAEEPAVTPPEASSAETAPAPNAEENIPPPFVFRQAEGFSIVSYDSVSADHLAQKCRDLLRWFSGQFRWYEPLQPYDIRVDLVPPFEADWAGPYHLKVEPRRINVLIRWDKETREADVQRALAHALLARIYQQHGAPAPDVNVPGWLVLAFQKEISFREQPALLELWARQARLAPVPPLAQFTEEKPRAVGAPVMPAEPAEVLQAFWFRRVLQQEPQLASPVLLRALARGYPLSQLLEENLPKATWEAPARRALWLPVRYQQLTRRGTSPTLSMRESQEYLRESQRFVFPVDGVPTVLAPEALLALRDRKEVQSEVFRRLAKLRIDIARANPVWWNAWHSYGLFLEHFSSAPESDLRQLWQLTEADARDARQLENDIRRALNQPPAQP